MAVVEMFVDVGEYTRDIVEAEEVFSLKDFVKEEKGRQTESQGKVCW